MWVYLPTTVDDYSAMQWPAPDGFHIPSKDEWTMVKTIWTTLWWWNTDWTNFWLYLKIPFAWLRNRSNVISSQWIVGYYWNSKDTHPLFISGLALNPNYATWWSAFWYSIRAFKNTSAIPDNSWTKLYWTSIESWWIFWSSADWLISLSSDWQAWITIQDKNLWATTVWNNWATLSEANCWKYFQRWNNYWFSWTWSTAESTTRVDASNYWPWNYYNSSTFIKSDLGWDSSNNPNLRWWVTWVVPKIVQKELKNAYIGEYRVPGVNTVAYYPLNWDVNDYLWNYNWTWSWTSAYKTLSSWIQVAYFPETNALSYITSSCTVLPSTVSFWMQKELFYPTVTEWVQLIGQANSETWSWQLRWDCHANSNRFVLEWGWGYIWSALPNFWNTDWHNVVITIQPWDVKVYYDTNLYGTSSSTLYANWNLFIGGNNFGANGTNKREMNGCMSEVILEDKVRTAQEIANYYNSTKSLYWIS